MSGSIEIWRMNAFTGEPFGGNPAGVVLDGDSLSDAQMQALAPELNSVSETAYVCTPADPSADIRLRYFTSTTEVDLCGHATVAALFALAASGRFTGTDEIRSIRAETRAGVLDLDLEFVDRRPRWASMIQPPPRHARPSAAARAAEILGLPPEAVRGDPPIAACSTGLWTCYVPLADLDALAAIRIDRDAIGALWPENPDFVGLYPFVVTERAGPHAVSTQGRFFCPPRFGIPEDPVTGTAGGALGAYLIEHGVLGEDGELTARQGVEMGRPGQLRARRTAGGAMVIRGQAVSIFSGRLTI